MLNDKQIKIADYLLKYLDSKGGRSSLNDYPLELDKQGFDYMDRSFVPDFLREHLSLIEYWGDAKIWITLTPNGYKASKIGLRKYLEQVEKEKQLETDSLSATIEGVRNAKRTAKISICCSIIAIVISLIVPFINSRNQSDTKGQNGKNKTDQRVYVNINDSVIDIRHFKDSIKNSLKHDSVFLNDIKQLINKK
jgi:hypothetical protein